MDAHRFTELTQFLTGIRSRRATVLVTLGGAALAADLLHAPPANPAKKRRRHRQRCPAPPTPPPPPFCQAKNQCAQAASVPCEASGTACQCWVRADTAAPICGSLSATSGSCACAAGTVCVVLGGFCVGGFGCVTPCPNPR